MGAGFSGALQAINLLRHEGPRATLIERRPQPGRGIAYTAAHPDHLLNVRAANMSALPDDPQHFVRWLEREGRGQATSFAPRIVYGDYLSALLAEAVAKAPDRLEIVQDDAIDLAMSGGGARTTLKGGRVIESGAAVLAIGNLLPHAPPAIDPAALGADLYAADPWDGHITDGLGPDDTVLLLGTGLTMVDAALLLEARGFGGRIVAMSRRGLLPRAHEAVTPPDRPLTERPDLVASGLLAAVRDRGERFGWRAAVDELRPFTQGMWLAADEDRRRRFTRHLRPWWDVHRHRLAPPVAARIAALQADGRLVVAAGKLGAAEPAGAGVRLTWRPRGQDAAETMTVRRIVNCTGPTSDVERSDEPLLRQLRARGLVRPDPLHLGLEVDTQAQVIGAGGTPVDNLYAVGPLTRSAFWEVVAVPDIRVQTWALARRLSNAHWVGGEGL